MTTISNALNAFRKLLDYQYHFTISHSKKLFDILLAFDERDFYHLDWSAKMPEGLTGTFIS